MEYLGKNVLAFRVSLVICAGTQPQLQVLLPKQAAAIHETGLSLAKTRSQVKVPTVRSSTEDTNRDGIADTLQLSLDGWFASVFTLS